MDKKLYLIGATAVVALALACGDKNPSPAAPTPASTSAEVTSSGAAADGSTLKVPAPTPTAPANGAQTADFNIVLKVNPVTAKFVNETAFAYHFQVLLNNQVVRGIPLGRDAMDCLRPRQQRDLLVARPRRAGAPTLGRGRIAGRSRRPTSPWATSTRTRSTTRSSTARPSARSTGR